MLMHVQASYNRASNTMAQHGGPPGGGFGGFFYGPGEAPGFNQGDAQAMAPPVAPPVAPPADREMSTQEREIQMAQESYMRDMQLRDHANNTAAAASALFNLQKLAVGGPVCAFMPELVRLACACVRGHHACQ